MHNLKTTSFNKLFASIARDEEIYNSLSPDERAEVDAFNAKIKGQPITEILRLTEEHPDKKHPFVKYRLRAKEKS